MKKILVHKGENNTPSQWLLKTSSLCFLLDNTQAFPGSKPLQSRFQRSVEIPRYLRLYALLTFLFSVSCASAPLVKNADPIDNDVIEKETYGGTSKMMPKEGLTKTFSYRQLRWDYEEAKVLYKLGTPSASFINDDLKLFTFPSKTRGYKTTVTTGLVDNKLVTLDINIADPTLCEEALPKWRDALRLKYGPITAEKDNYILWKLEDASIIVIEKGARCGIIYAKDSDARKSVNARVK